MTKRKRLPIRHVRLLLKRQDGTCAAPGCKTVLVLGPKGQHTNFIDEHRVPLAMKGTNALKNRELRCRTCADKKTHGTRSTSRGGLGGDISEIRRVGRQRDKHKVRKPVPSSAKALPKRDWKSLLNALQPWPKPKRKMQSRPFAKRKKP